MIRLLTLSILMLCLNAQAAYVTISVTFTNIPATSDSNTVNGAVSRWTNGPLNSTTFIQTNGIAGSATNLLRFMGANYQRFYSRMTNATNVSISGEGLQFHITGNFGYTTTNSATGTNWHALLLPWDMQPYSTNKTNDADELIYGLGKYALTSSIPAGAQAFTNFFDRSTVQRGGNKQFTNSLFSGGTNDGTSITNAPRVYGTNAGFDSAVIGSATIRGGSLSNVVLTNASGKFTSSVFLDPFLGGTVNGTNVISWGNLYIGSHETGIYTAWALRTGTNLNGDELFQIYNDTMLGSPLNIITDGGGYYWTLSGNMTNDGIFYSPDIYASTLTSTSVIAIAFLQGSNTVHLGTNKWIGDISITAGTYSSLVDSPGNNTDIVIPTNRVVNFSGATNIANICSFRKKREGYEFEARFAGGFGTNWIIHNSGAEGDTTQRFYTKDGQNIPLTNTYNRVGFRQESSGWEIKYVY